MDRVDDSIVIGNYVEAKDINLLRANGIRFILCLDDDLIPRTPEDLGVESVDVVALKDGPAIGQSCSRQLLNRHWTAFGRRQVFSCIVELGTAGRSVSWRDV
jgi:hypothetical protein